MLSQQRIYSSEDHGEKVVDGSSCSSVATVAIIGFLFGIDGGGVNTGVEVTTTSCQSGNGVNISTVVIESHSCTGSCGIASVEGEGVVVLIEGGLQLDGSTLSLASSP